MKKKNKYLVEVGYILNGNRYAMDIIRLDSNDIILSESDLEAIKDNKDSMTDLSNMLTLSGESKVKEAYPEFIVSDENDYVCLVNSNLSSNIEEYIHRKSCVNDIINMQDAEMVLNSDDTYNDTNYKNDSGKTYITLELIESNEAPYVNEANVWVQNNVDENSSEENACYSYIMHYPYSIPIDIVLTTGLRNMLGNAWQLKVISYYDSISEELCENGFVELITFINTVEEMKNILKNYSKLFS